MNKKDLIREFFDISHSYMRDEYKKILSKFEAYNETHDDRDIRHLSLVAKAYILYDESHYNDELYEIVDPIFEYLTELDNWTVLDLKIYSMIIQIAETYEEAALLKEKAMEEIKKFKPSELPKKLIIGIHINLLGKILEAYFFDLTYRQTSELELLFKENFEVAYKIAKKNNYKDMLAYILISKGLLEDIDELINSGLNLSKEYSDKLYEYLEKYVERFKRWYYMKLYLKINPLLWFSPENDTEE